MASLAKLNYTHFENCLGNYLTILLGDTDKLCHVLHTPDRLENLAIYCDERLATVRELLLVLREIRRALAGYVFISLW